MGGDPFLIVAIAGTQCQAESFMEARCKVLGWLDGYKGKGDQMVRRKQITPAEDELNQHVGFGARLLAARDAAKIKQAELARMMGIGRSVLSKWELGQRGMTTDRFAQACQILGVDPSGILGLRQDYPLPSVNRRLLLLIRAKGDNSAMRRLGIAEPAMESVLKALYSGKLLIANSQLEMLAEASGVSYGWLLTGNPRLWTPSIRESWSSRLKLFRFSIGGFPDGEDGKWLTEVFMEGEGSEGAAKTLLIGPYGEKFRKMLVARQGSDGAWSKQIRADFPFDFEGLCLENPIFRPIPVAKESEPGPEQA